MLKPATVVKVVIKTGRNLNTPASIIESLLETPSLRILLIKSTRTMESLTTMPVKPTIPKIARKLKFNPCVKKANTTPINPKGIVNNTTKG